MKITRVRTVVGGLHLARASEEECISIVEKLKALGVEKIGAIHCSGDTIRNILAEENMLLNIHVGSRIMISREGVSIKTSMYQKECKFPLPFHGGTSI